MNNDYSYDSECEELARYFLPEGSGTAIWDFAQHIQKAVEAWLKDHEDTQ